MSSKRHIRRKKCSYKVRHTSVASAQVVAARLRRKYGGDIGAYGCKNCGGYHVGHMPGWVARKIERRKNEQ